MKYRYSRAPATVVRPRGNQIDSDRLSKRLPYRREARRSSIRTQFIVLTAGGLCSGRLPDASGHNYANSELTVHVAGYLAVYCPRWRSAIGLWAGRGRDRDRSTPLWCRYSIAMRSSPIRDLWPGRDADLAGRQPSTGDLSPALVLHDRVHTAHVIDRSRMVCQARRCVCRTLLMCVTAPARALCIGSLADAMVMRLLG